MGPMKTHLSFVVSVVATCLFLVGCASPNGPAVAPSPAAPEAAPQADVAFAGPFSDGAVLQREMRVPVWGTARPGERVTVTFAGQTVQAVANDTGAWRVDLAPMDACREGRDLVATGESGARAVAHDVLVGEVWFCSGQSNCELPLVGGSPRFRDGKGSMRAQLTNKPLVRFCKQSNYKISTEPRGTCRKPPQWLPFTPENLAKPSFSAMGVYFALEIFSALDIPVGIVGMWWGGTKVEPWTPASGLASVPETAELAETPVLPDQDLNAIPEEERPFRRPQDQPRVLWNDMLAPWAPYAMRGFIWYQGCSNVADGPAYASKMHALYNGWAKEFENPSLKIRFVQLAPWGDGRVSALQEAQAAFADEEPNAKMAVANDLGNLADIHPNDKETVGQRLALLALKYDYGFDIKADSPAPCAWRVEGDAFVVEFDHAQSLYLYNPDRSLDAVLEVCGGDGEWKPGKIRNLNGTGGNIEGAKLVVAAEGVPEPKKLRYLHARPWFGCLYNEVNLPAGAFELSAD